MVGLWCFLAYLFDLHEICVCVLSTYLNCREVPFLVFHNLISQIQVYNFLMLFQALSDTHSWPLYVLVRSVSKVLLPTAFCLVPNVSIGSGISMSIFILLFVYIPSRIGIVRP